METKRRRTAGWLSAMLVASVMMALSVAVAAGHTTTVTQADPAAGSTVDKSPAQVRVQFSEEVVSQGSTLKVSDASGKQVSQGDGELDLNDPNHQIMLAALPSPLPDGVYTVRYHVVLTDGDATDDSYTFTVQPPDAPAAQQATATTAPAAAPTGATGVTPATAAITPSPAAATAATAPPTVGAPGTLPTTGGSGGSRFIWPVAAMAVILLVLGLTVRLQRNAH